MRNTTGIVVFSAFCCLAGCNSRPPASPKGADASFGWTWYAFKELKSEAGDGGVSAWWGSWKKKFVYVILADPAISITTDINASGARTEYQVDLTLPNGQKAELRIETADGKTGSAVYDRRSYDLAQGPVFVLLAKSETIEMLQLQRDISDGIVSLQKLLQDDQEIARIFAKMK